MLRILYEELMIFSIDNVWPLFLLTIATSVFFIVSRKITYKLLFLIAKYEALCSMISLIFKPVLKVVEVVYKTTAAMFAITLLMIIINKIF